MNGRFPLGAPTREAYGNALVDLGRVNQGIVVLDADLSTSTNTFRFARQFPERFFNCGLAEQNMMGVAAGLAASGKTVFASSFAVFATSRCFDQLRVLISQPGLNVKIVASHGGITVGEDGASHQAVEDLALMCSLVRFKVVVPTDEVETPQVIQVAAATDGPFYVRCGRSKVPTVYPPDYQFVLGKGVVLKEGLDATVIANGLMVAPSLEAAYDLEEEGIHCRVLGMPTLKPLDEEAIFQAALETGAIVTAEEHLLHGGLGSRVAQVVAERSPVPMAFVGLRDTYGESGKPDELLEKYGLTSKEIARAARSVMRRKHSLLDS